MTTGFETEQVAETTMAPVPRATTVSRVAIIGAGAVTEKKHLPALAVSERLEVTALVDLDEGRARRLAQEFRIPRIARQCSELAGHADIALVAVPHHLHARVAIQAMEAGLHPFVEKPLAANMADVRLMTTAADRLGRRIGVGLVRRQYSTFRFVKSVLERGWLGQIASFDVREGGAYNWPVATDATFRKATQGGVLFDTGAHTLDMVLAWLGAFEQVRYADDRRTGVDANAVLALTLASGVRGTIELSRTRNLRNTCIIRGERGEIEVGMGPRGPVVLRADGLELSGAPQVAGEDEPAPLEYTRIQLEEFAGALQSGGHSELFAEHTLESIRLFDACMADIQPLEFPWEPFEAPFDFSQLNGRRVLVLGGTGFVGGRLVEVLAANTTARVRVMARSFARLAAVSRFDVEVIPGDITDRAALAKALDGCDIVVNCTYGRGSRQASQLVNVDAVQLLVEEAARAKVGRVVHLSTVAAYGPVPDGDLDEGAAHHAPRDQVYGYTKWQGEQAGLSAARSHGVDFRVLQPTVIYGPGAPSWTLNPLRMLKSGRVALINGGTGLCNTVYVDDMVLAILCAATANEGAGERFLISGPAPATWREFYGAYEAMLGFTSTAHVPHEEMVRLARQARRRGGTAAQLVSILREPVLLRRLGGVPIVQKIKEAVPRTTVEAVKHAVGGPAAPREPRQGSAKPLHLWTEADAAFQASRTRVSIAKAQRLLGYRPIYPLGAGMERNRQWAEWANLL